MKKRIYLVLIGVCVLSLLVGAWTSTPLKAEEITLVLAGYYPPSYYKPGKPFAPVGDFVDNVNRMGKGKIKINAYWSGKLLGPRALIPGLMKGTADMIVHTGTYTAGAFPIMTFEELPFFWKSTESFYEHTRMGADIRKILDKELEEKHGIKLVAFGAADLEPLWLGKKRVKKPKDLKGLKIRSAGIGQAWTLRAFGAAPVGMVSAEMYEGMSRGTIDGMVTHQGTIYARKIYEVLGSCIDANFAGESIDYFMKKDKWDALPQDVRDIITKAAKIYEYDMPHYDIKMRQGHFSIFREKGMEIVKLTPEEKKEFKRVAKKAWKDFEKKVGSELAGKIIKLAGH